MRYAKVLVERSEHLSVPALVLPWEVPILASVHGAEKVSENGFESVDREYPDVDVEFDRLSRRYGEHTESGVPWVAKVYGEPPLGVRALAAAIEDERKAERAAGGKPASKKPVTKAPGAKVKALAVAVDPNGL